MNNQPSEDQPEFWYNTKTNQVEKGLISAAPYRIGPFLTQAEAARALQIIAERSKTWREEEADN